MQKGGSLAGSPNAFRAVGNILNKNYDLKISCHRVVKSNGGVGGYNRRSRRKNNLLKLENMVVRSRKVVL